MESKQIYNINLSILAVVMIALMAMNVYLISTETKSMDINIFRNAANLYKAGSDPYDLNNIVKVTGGEYPFRYPPVTLDFFFYFTRVSHLIMYAVLFLFIFFMVKKTDKNFNPLLFFVVLATGFYSTYKNFTIGNIGLIELSLFAVGFYFIVKNKYHLAAFMIGLTAIFKAVPLAYLLLFLLFPIEWYKRIFYFLIGFAVWYFSHVMNLLLFPELSKGYYNLMLNNYPVIDATGFFNPCLFSLLKDGLEGFSLYFIYFSAVAVIGMLLIYFIRWGKLNITKISSFGIIAVMLALPELKHYSYVFALIPAYFIIKDYGHKEQFYLIILISVLPMLTNFIYYMLGWKMLGHTFFYFFRAYIPYFSLLIFYVLTGLKEVKYARNKLFI